MLLSRNDLSLLSELAISAAKQAGQLIANYDKDNLSAQPKKGGSSLASQVVTEVDHLSQAAILELIQPSCEQYNLALLTEESDDNLERLEKDYFWCIDPLDGTLSFIDSSFGYAISIALVAKTGVPIIGVIYDPVTGNLYHAIKGMGAYRNNQPWALQQRKDKPLTLVSDRSLAKQKYFEALLLGFQEIAGGLGLSGINIFKHGGAVMNAMWVLENSPAVYFKFPKPQDGGGSLWDFSASTCIFSEIGAIACNIDGNTLELNRVESTFMNHQGVIFTTEAVLVDKVSQLFKKLLLS